MESCGICNHQCPRERCHPLELFGRTGKGMVNKKKDEVIVYLTIFIFNSIVSILTT